MRDFNKIPASAGTTACTGLSVARRPDRPDREVLWRAPAGVRRYRAMA